MEAEVTTLVPDTSGPSTAKLVFGAPMWLGAIGMVGALLMILPMGAPVGLAIIAVACVVGAWKLREQAKAGQFGWHNVLERRPLKGHQNPVDRHGRRSDS